MIRRTTGRCADVRATAHAAQDETELRRDYAALMAVRDPVLDRRAAEIALSADVPAQADALRLQLILQLQAAKLTREFLTASWYGYNKIAADLSLVISEQNDIVPHLQAWACGFGATSTGWD